MENKAFGVGLAVTAFLIVAGIIFALMYYFNLIAYLIIMIGTLCLIVLVLGVLIIGVVLIIALFYFMGTKKPEVQETGNYSLDDTIDTKAETKKQQEKK